MSGKRFVIACVISIASATTCLACLWDTDTLQMERLRFPGVLEIITGKFVRHSKAYYEWRIVDRTKKLEAKPGDPALIDDLAVAYAKLGRPEEGIPLLEKVLEQHPERYETLSNRGTLLFFAGRLEDSKRYIRQALEINPDAHFGRERYQLLLTEYLEQSRQRDVGVMSTGSREPSEVGRMLPGFAGYVKEAELQKATRGVLGMMHFADFQSPILLEALGDLLLAGSTEEDAALHAARAYLRAAEFSREKGAADAFRKMAHESLAMYIPESHRFERLESELKAEVESAAEWFAEIERNEKKWIESGDDVDRAFAGVYYESLESTISAAANEVSRPAVPANEVGRDSAASSEVSPTFALDNTWLTPIGGVVLAVALLATLSIVIRRQRRFTT